MRKMVNHLEKFTVANVSKKLNKINVKISLSHQKPFPNTSLLSHDQFEKKFVKIFPNGSVQGGYAKMIISLIDFSFIRSLVADCYSPYGPPCYDPPTLFLLDLFRYIDAHQDMSHFLDVLRDEDRGRAYDQKGWPFAPCGLLNRPNGFDQKHQRLTFCCFKQCLNLRHKALQSLQSRYNITQCPHIKNQTGFSKHMYVKKHPRLINEIPRVLQGLRANILAQLAAIVFLLKRTFSFIVRITNQFRKLHETNDLAIKEKLEPPFIPKSIQNLIQLK